METSTSIVEIAKALTAFQGKVDNVKKDGLNPHFRSKYATLDTLINTIRKPLADSGLSFSQLPVGDNSLCTIVMHTSGEWLKSTAKMYPAKNDPQGQGSAITYMRRYALGAALGIATEEDDDGNAASSNQSERKPMKPYVVTRKVSPTTETPKTMSDDNILEAQKDEIKELVKGLGKIPTPRAIKQLAGVDMKPENYRKIINTLKGLNQNTPEEALGNIVGNAE